MNFKRVLLSVILLTVVFLFLLGSYLTGHLSTVIVKGTGRYPQRWSSVLNVSSWGHLGGKRGSLVIAGDDRTSPEESGNLETTIEDLRRGIDRIGAKALSLEQTTRINAKARDMQKLRMIKHMVQNMDGDLRVQYFTQVGQYEAEHSKPISKFSASVQWDFLVDFMGTSGHTQHFPNVINIGVKKSGTNALGFFITQHPLIAHSIGNEVHFFDWNYARGLEYYRSRMGFASKYQLSFEKTPRYFVTESVPRNILKDLGNRTKFILCLRDPIDRMISDYRHERELALRRRGDMRNVLNRPKSSPETEGKILEALIVGTDGRINASQDAIRTSSYSIHLKNWLRYHPIDRFHFIDHDALTVETFTVMEGVEQFLDLYSYFKPGMFFYDSERRGTCVFGQGTDRRCPAKSTPGFLPKAKLDAGVEAKLMEYFGTILQEFIEMTGVRYPWMDKYL